MWIYKHAFFRRDEPELLHALKRKTNQHGARIGVVGPDVDDEMVEQPPRVVTSSPRRCAYVCYKHEIVCFVFEIQV